MDSTINFKIQRPLNKGERFFLRSVVQRTGVIITEKQLQAGNSIELPNTKGGRAIERQLAGRLN